MIGSGSKQAAPRYGGDRKIVHIPVAIIVLPIARLCSRARHRRIQIIAIGSAIKTGIHLVFVLIIVVIPRAILIDPVVPDFSCTRMNRRIHIITIGPPMRARRVAVVILIVIVVAGAILIDPVVPGFWRASVDGWVMVFTVIPPVGGGIMPVPILVIIGISPTVRINAVIPVVGSARIHGRIRVHTIIPAIRQSVVTIFVLIKIIVARAIRIQAVVPGFRRPRKHFCIRIITIGSARCTASNPVSVRILFHQRQYRQLPTGCAIRHRHRDRPVSPLRRYQIYRKAGMFSRIQYPFRRNGERVSGR